MANSPPESITPFWEDQLQRTTQIVEGATQFDTGWLQLIPREIASAEGKIRLAALMSLMYQYNMGGSAWLQQFLFGFKLTGTFSQIHTFPPSDKLKGEQPCSLDLVMKANDRRFTERAQKSGFKNATKLWSEAISQQQKGWLSAPSALTTWNSPFILKDSKLNIAFRFGVEQADKLRACDDLRYSMTNLACLVQTPIKLASWDHVAKMCKAIQGTQRDWHFFKADHEAAYKQLPIAWEQSKLAVVALRSPSDGRRYGFMSKTLMFGAVSAVIHYNIFSRILAELTCRIFGIPMISYFDDFGALLPASIAKSGLNTFTKWCHVLGISLKTAKSEVGTDVTFLGLLGSFPSKHNGMQLRVTLTPEKAAKWTAIIHKHLKEGLISSHELEKLIGKLCFSQTCLFGKFASTQLRCLYTKLHAPRYSAKLSKAEILTLNWRADVISQLSPRIPRLTGGAPDFVLYTDAATSTCRIAALLFKGGNSPPLSCFWQCQKLPITGSDDLTEKTLSSD